MLSENSRIRVVVRSASTNVDPPLMSTAVDFLLGHNFRMEAPFLLGVPYLSREEEATSRSLEIARRDRNTFVDIFVQDDDIKSIEFVRRVRQEVSAWSNRKTVRDLSSSSLTDGAWSDVVPA